MNQNESEIPWVSASEIGRATYCPYALYLSAQGEALHADNRRQMNQGTVGHAHWEGKRSLQPRMLRQLAMGLFLLVLVILLVTAIVSSR